MKNSFISTVYNEENSIEEFIKSILDQTLKPDEIIIVDGGSTDNTISHFKKYKDKIKFFAKKGNRAVGRNAAIEAAKGKIILCSDAGCILDKDWVRNITAPFKNTKIDVVAGYYKGIAKNVFQKSLIPYVLVMQDKINEKYFLPASRSMAFRKSIWKKVGGFPEAFSHNEDYVFAQRLKMIGAKIIFVRNAIVYWIPRENLQKAFYMFYRFARGDMEAGMVRPKVILLFARYLAGFILLLMVLKEMLLMPFIGLIVVLYIVWSIQKNYRYVDDWRAIFLLPLMQFTTDIAILVGSITGIIGIVRGIFPKWDIHAKH